MISMFTSTARGLCRTLDSIATPCSVKAYGRYRLPPHELEVPDWLLMVEAGRELDVGVHGVSSPGGLLAGREDAEGV
jgi:hypothetical protein